MWDDGEESCQQTKLKSYLMNEICVGSWFVERCRCLAVCVCQVNVGELKGGAVKYCAPGSSCVFMSGLSAAWDWAD